MEDAGTELVQLDLVRASGQVIVRLLVEKKEGGINLGGCAIINRRLSDILEEQNIISDRYLVEVSSPGLDRPLKTKKDFSRCLNKKVKFFLHEAVNGKIEWDGIIKDATDTDVSVEIDGELVGIPLAKINKAKLLF
jgi:ribosome maturation factor RimP